MRGSLEKAIWEYLRWNVPEPWIHYCEPDLAYNPELDAMPLPSFGTLNGEAALLLFRIWRFEELWLELGEEARSLAREEGVELLPEGDKRGIGEYSALRGSIHLRTFSREFVTKRRVHYRDRYSRRFGDFPHWFARALQDLRDTRIREDLQKLTKAEFDRKMRDVDSPPVRHISDGVSGKSEIRWGQRYSTCSRCGKVTARWIHGNLWCDNCVRYS